MFFFYTTTPQIRWRGVLGILLLLVIAFGGFCTEARAITLTYATNTDPSGLRGIAEQSFIDEIERLGNGTIHVKIFWEQSYLKDKEILEGVKDGTVDMGHVNINYYPGRLVVNGAITLLQQGPSKYNHRMWTYESVYDKIPQLNAEFLKYNQKIVYTYSVLPLAGAFTQPVASLKDFKNRRIRASSHWLLKILEGVGAVPISLPWSDCYMALKTNALEGIYTNIDAIHRTKLDEVAPHLLIFREFWNPVPFHITINIDTWRHLPTEVQDIIRTASTRSKARLATLYESMLDEVVAAQKQAGYDVAFAQKEDIETWLKLPEINKIRGLWIKKVSPIMTRKEAQALLFKLDTIIAQGMEKDKDGEKRGISP